MDQIVWISSSGWTLERRAIYKLTVINYDESIYCQKKTFKFVGYVTCTCQTITLKRVPFNYIPNNMITELYVLFVCFCECKSVVVGSGVLWFHLLFLLLSLLHSALIFTLQAQLHAMTWTKSAMVEIDCINVFII